MTRKSGEAINVGDEITVTVLEIRGNQVRLGIQAPLSVIIHRKELVREDKDRKSYVFRIVAG